MMFIRFARTLSLSVCAFSLSVSPLFAANVVVDLEAERAKLEGMNIEDALSITHVIADKKYEGSVTFTFDLKVSGEYYLEAKTIAKDKSHDSFAVSFNQDRESVWHVPRSKEWEWNPVDTKETPDGIVTLQAGSNTLTFHGREQTRLDRIRLIEVDVDESTRIKDESSGAAEPETGKDTTSTPESKTDETIAGDQWYVATTGSDDAAGSKKQPFKSINAALERAYPGDVIYVRSGTYTETIQSVRSGTSDKQITVIAEDVSKSPVIDLKWDKNAVEIKHSYITLRGFEIKNFREGIRIEGATGVELRDNNIHHGKNECVRVRYHATKNLIANNSIHFCGATDSDSRIDSGNGEAIYIGTAPEQREKNGGKPDPSTHNRIIGNRIYDATEGVDLKEDSNYTEVSDNVIYRMSDKNSGAINVRGDKNIIKHNTVYENAGSGFRFGGDDDVKTADGETHDYGVDNDVDANQSSNNEEFGYKLMREEQNFSCTNTSNDNREHSNSDAFDDCF